ncbi:hypothetical protein [Sphingomonas sp. LaA6.9]|uniref:hypothetical protein n=1 Tax=Sphingomonas sp. LaA6.9 TaxID=2919914 RepID=UPI001F5037AC|nr:hypothetical protein [Sphingomonas sp. LaA6.9]MCJ8157492.1 hypothetical protein [Sphingomonas sp. LaA6.9]
MRAPVLHGITAALLITTPAFAQAQSAAQPAASTQPVQRLSLANSPAIRAGAATTNRNRASDGNWGWIIGGVALAAGVIYALVEVEGDDDDDFPASP